MKKAVVGGRAYNIADTNQVNLHEALRLVGLHLKNNSLEKAIPANSQELTAKNYYLWRDFPAIESDTYDSLVSTDRARDELGFASTPVAEALADSTDFYLVDRGQPKAGISYEQEEELMGQLRGESEPIGKTNA